MIYPFNKFHCLFSVTGLWRDPHWTVICFVDGIHSGWSEEIFLSMFMRWRRFTGGGCKKEIPNDWGYYFFLHIVSSTKWIFGFNVTHFSIQFSREFGVCPQRSLLHGQHSRNVLSIVENNTRCFCLVKDAPNICFVLLMSNNQMPPKLVNLGQIVYVTKFLWESLLV